MEKKYCIFYQLIILLAATGLSLWTKRVNADVAAGQVSTAVKHPELIIDSFTRGARLKDSHNRLDNGFRVVGTIRGLDSISLSTRPIIFALSGDLGNKFTAAISDTGASEDGPNLTFAASGGFLLKINRQTGALYADSSQPISSWGRDPPGVYLRIGNQVACTLIDRDHVDPIDKKHRTPCPPLSELFVARYDRQTEGRLASHHIPENEPYSVPFVVWINEGAGVDPNTLVISSVDDHMNRIGEPLCKMTPNFSQSEFSNELKRIQGDGIYSCDVEFHADGSEKARGLLIVAEAKVNGVRTIAPKPQLFDVVERGHPWDPVPTFFTPTPEYTVITQTIPRVLRTFWIGNEEGDVLLQHVLAELRKIPLVLDARINPIDPKTILIHLKSGRSTTPAVPKSYTPPPISYRQVHIEPPDGWLAWLCTAVGLVVMFIRILREKDNLPRPIARELSTGKKIALGYICYGTAFWLGTCYFSNYFERALWSLNGHSYPSNPLTNELNVWKFKMKIALHLAAIPIAVFLYRTRPNWVTSWFALTPGLLLASQFILSVVNAII